MAKLGERRCTDTHVCSLRRIQAGRALHGSWVLPPEEAQGPCLLGAGRTGRKGAPATPARGEGSSPMTSPQGLWRRNAGGGGPAGLCSSCVCRHHIEVRVPQARRQGVGTPPHSRTSHPACTCLKRCPPPHVCLAPRCLWEQDSKNRGQIQASWVEPTLRGGRGQATTGGADLLWCGTSGGGQTNTCHSPWGPSPPAHCWPQGLCLPLAPGTGPRGLRPHEVPSSCLWVGRSSGHLGRGHSGPPTPCQDVLLPSVPTAPGRMWGSPGVASQPRDPQDRTQLQPPHRRAPILL